MNNNLFKKIYGLPFPAKEFITGKNLIKKIEKGFENNEFKMYLQFIIDNKTKKIAMAEALSRWENLSGEVIFPGEYIGLMEKSGLIVKFDYYMFEKVCQKLSEWENTEFSNVAISCNMTRITISQRSFVERIKEIADKYEFDSVEKNLEVARNNIVKVKELGFSIALDDIGSGYTSLTSLCEYPIDVVKIDRDFVLLSDREDGKKLLLGIISLAHSLNLKTVCEGVETEEQNALISESECDYIQGWYYTKALPEEKSEEFCREYMKKF